jgi:hypothetical protein
VSAAEIFIDSLETKSEINNELVTAMVHKVIMVNTRIEKDQTPGASITAQDQRRLNMSNDTDRSNCTARRYNDQMICGGCGLQWDVKDDDPPSCKKVTTGKKTIENIRKNLDSSKRSC